MYCDVVLCYIWQIACDKDTQCRLIAEEIDRRMTQSGIQKLCERLKVTGSIKNQPGKWHRRATTAQADRRIVRMAVRNRRIMRSMNRWRTVESKWQVAQFRTSGWRVAYCRPPTYLLSCTDSKLWLIIPVCQVFPMCSA